MGDGARKDTCLDTMLRLCSIQTDILDLNRVSPQYVNNLWVVGSAVGLPLKVDTQI